VLLCQTLILGVCFEQYVPRAARDTCHAFLPQYCDPDF
jgi:hypothetical protein